MIKDFFNQESSGGIVLIVAAIAAIIIANSPLDSYYHLLLSTEVEMRVADYNLVKPLLLWINDGLMTIFFFVVGLELKRELLEGELSDIRQIAFPAIGALGGMIVPAGIYVFFNSNDPVALKGWAIPAATDIAFALGILALLGSRVPLALKIFLTSLAIFDDIGAIIIIAMFYTANISGTALLIVIFCILILTLYNRGGVQSKSLYIVTGVIMWAATLKSGVHATLSGVILAMFIPLRGQTPEASPLKELEHDFHKLVAFFVLPWFAFANAGLDLSGVTMDKLLHDVPLGIAAGLFFGKQIGIFGFCWLAIKMGYVKLPKGMNMLSLFGTAALCGVGFTMSLFIGTLAFEQTGIKMLFDERLGIIIGSLASGIVGYLILRFSLQKSTS